MILQFEKIVATYDDPMQTIESGFGYPRRSIGGNMIKIETSKGLSYKFLFSPSFSYPFMI